MNVQNSSNVLYRYALASDGSLVDVATLDPTNRGGPYTCLSCGGSLVPKLGAVVSHHFAHRSDAPCSSESYLHKLAKRVFVQEWERRRVIGKPWPLFFSRFLVCSAFEDSLQLSKWKFLSPGSCSHSIQSINLIDRYDRIEIEASLDGCIVDILLTHSSCSSRRLSIEIEVSHRCDSMKIDKGFQILELPIRSDSDIDNLRMADLGRNFGRLINFDRLPMLRVPDYSCSSCCGFDLFVLYSSGKPFLLQHYKGESLRGDPVFIRHMGFSIDLSAENTGQRFFEGVCLALEAGHTVNWRPSNKKVWANLFNWLRWQGEKGQERARLLGVNLRPVVRRRSYRSWS